jgi:hypothetical protein
MSETISEVWTPEYCEKISGDFCKECALGGTYLYNMQETDLCNRKGKVSNKEALKARQFQCYNTLDHAQSGISYIIRYKVEEALARDLKDSPDDFNDVLLAGRLVISTIEKALGDTIKKNLDLIVALAKDKELE